ncbi:hypothetical protein [Porphyrobacter sp. CACIAM 03H1]|uniref:hypothetical protein n=1 Tax=Porphyrobacter sp. CACIAM 03H1 TaxID=2003315 RepID=UPI000B5A2E96|nr:hypothetical protein [Porphyrobacter sp. CACIAM 03H1]ASJ90669.1 hypothetical protein CBR61_06840 [Porphyrobacter sp. CACIAM 03H1]
MAAMTHNMEFFVCASFEPVAKVMVMPVLVKPDIRSTTTTPDLATARKLARNGADLLGCELEDTCEEPAE